MAEDPTTHVGHGTDTEAHAPETVSRRLTVPRLAIPAPADTLTGDAASPSAADQGGVPPTTPFPAAATPAGDGVSVDLSAMPTARILQHLYRQAAAEARAAGRPPPAEATRHLNPFRMRLMSVGRVTAAKRTSPGTPMGPAGNNNSSMSTADVAASYAAAVAASAGVPGHAAGSHPPTTPHPSLGRTHLTSPVAADHLGSSSSSSSSPHGLHVDASVIVDVGSSKQQQMHPPASPMGKRPGVSRCTSRFAAGARQACDVPAVQPPLYHVDKQEHDRQPAVAARPVSIQQQQQQQQQQALQWPGSAHASTTTPKAVPHPQQQWLPQGEQSLPSTPAGGVDATLGRWMPTRGEAGAATSGGGGEVSFGLATAACTPAGAAQQPSHIPPWATGNSPALPHAAAAAAAADTSSEAGDEAEEGDDVLEVTLAAGIRSTAPGQHRAPSHSEGHHPGSPLLSHHGPPHSSTSSNRGVHVQHPAHAHSCAAGHSCVMGAVWGQQGVHQGSSSVGMSGTHLSMPAAVQLPADRHRSKQRPASAPHGKSEQQQAHSKCCGGSMAATSSSRRRRAWSAIQALGGSNGQQVQQQGAGSSMDSVSSGQQQPNSCTIAATGAAASGAASSLQAVTQGRKDNWCTAALAEGTSHSLFSSGAPPAASSSECPGAPWRTNHWMVGGSGPRQHSSGDAAPARRRSDQPSSSGSPGSSWWETVAVHKKAQAPRRPCSAAETGNGSGRCRSSQGGRDLRDSAAADRRTSSSKDRAKNDSDRTQPGRRPPVSACEPSTTGPVVSQQQRQQQREHGSLRQQQTAAGTTARPNSAVRAPSLRTRTNLQAKSLPRGWWRQPTTALSDPLLLQLPGWVRLDLDLELLDT
jgi:hypothetical protein